MQDSPIPSPSVRTRHSPAVRVPSLGTPASTIWLAIGLALVALGVLPGHSVRAQESAGPQEAFRLLTLAYRLLPEDPASALPIFEQAVRLDSTNVAALRQLGSLYVGERRPAEALRAFQAAYIRAPSDTLALQIAYLASSLGMTEEAFSIFERLRRSDDAEIRLKARPAATLLGLMVCADQYPWWFRGQAYPFYDSRFENLILPFALYGGKYLEENRVVSLYGVLSVLADTRSEGGAFPVIFSDNYALAGTGFRFVPLAGLTADLQFGMAVNLLDRPGAGTVQGDVRAVVSYGTGFYAPVRMPETAQFGATPFAEAYTSVGYYSRYDNVIAYLQGRAGIRALEYRYSALDIYARLDASADGRGDFFNNVAEFGAGIRIIPNPWWGVSLACEYRRGYYWQSSQGDNPYDREYNSVRVYLLLDRFFCW